MKKYMMQILQEAASKSGPLCVGLDTDPSYIPDYIVNSIASSTEAVKLYNQCIIKGVAAENLACCVKVQIAYYEAAGVEGMKVYRDTLKMARESSLITIADIKRGDIGATSQAYARAHYTGDFEADIVTLNPYMGRDAIEPFMKYNKCGKGAFVLLCTSNGGAADIEKQTLKTGESVFCLSGSIIENINKEFARKGDKCGALGAVVGATQCDAAQYLRQKYPNTLFLIPGFGAQGGDLAVIKTLLSCAGGVVNSSRAILCAWMKDNSLKNKRESKTLCLDDIAQSAIRAARAAKDTLLNL